MADTVATPVVLVTSVELGKENVATIKLHEGEPPQVAAQTFCFHHGLPDSVIPPLVQHMEDNLRRLRTTNLTVSSSGASPAGSSSPSQEESVFDRLYVAAKAQQLKLDKERLRRHSELQSSGRRSISPGSRRLTEHHTKGDFANHGERLYAEGIVTLEKKKAMAEEYEQRRAEAELKGVTFHPKITRMAKQLKRQQGAKPWVRLTKSLSQRTMARMESLRKLNARKEVEGCTFKPNINKTSEMLVQHLHPSRKDDQKDTCQNLFQDAVRRHKRQQEVANRLPEDVTFKPQLMTSRRPKSSGAPERSKIPATQRLYEHWKVAERKMEDARKAHESRIDPATGKEKFKPNTGRAPHFNRNYMHLPVGEYLYLLGLENDDRKEDHVRTVLAMEKEEAERKKTSRHTEALMTKLKHRRFTTIFSYLDSKGEGALDLVALVFGDKTAVLDDLQPEILEDVKRAAELVAKRSMRMSRSANMEGEAGSLRDSLNSSKSRQDSASGTTMPTTGPLLNVSQFQEVMEDVLSKYRAPRSYLAPAANTNNSWDDHSFKPSILPKSKELAASRRSSNNSVYHMLYAHAHERTAKQMQKLREKEHSEMQECTFKPMLLTDKLPKEGRALRASQEISSFPSSSVMTINTSRRPSAVPGITGVPGQGGQYSDIRLQDLEAQVRQALDKLLGAGGLNEATGRLGSLLSGYSDRHSTATIDGTAEQQASGGTNGSQSIGNQSSPPGMSTPRANRKSVLSQQVLAATVPEISTWEADAEGDLVVNFHKMGLEALQKLAAGRVGSSSMRSSV